MPRYSKVYTIKYFIEKYRKEIEAESREYTTYELSRKWGLGSHNLIQAGIFGQSKGFITWLRKGRNSGYFEKLKRGMYDDTL